MIQFRDDEMTQFLDSLWKNRIGILLILVSAFALALGQFIWKVSAGEQIDLIVLGFFLYGIGAITMIIAYRYGSLSVLHPMMSVSYILAFVLGVLFLQEMVDLRMIGGLSLIILGNVLIGGGDGR